jgi:hypothetical protein
MRGENSRIGRPDSELLERMDARKLMHEETAASSTPRPLIPNICTFATMGFTGSAMDTVAAICHK